MADVPGFYAGRTTEGEAFPPVVVPGVTTGPRPVPYPPSADVRRLLAAVKELTAERDRLRRVLCRYAFACERCGQSGRQEAGGWNPASRAYDAPAGPCAGCGGTGWLGVTADAPGVAEVAAERDRYRAALEAIVAAGGGGAYGVAAAALRGDAAGGG